MGGWGGTAGETRALTSGQIPRPRKGVLGPQLPARPAMPRLRPGAPREWPLHSGGERGQGHRPRPPHCPRCCLVPVVVFPPEVTGVKAWRPRPLSSALVLWSSLLPRRPAPHQGQSERGFLPRAAPREKGPCHRAWGTQDLILTRWQPSLGRLGSRIGSGRRPCAVCPVQSRPRAGGSQGRNPFNLPLSPGHIWRGHSSRPQAAVPASRGCEGGRRGGGRADWSLLPGDSGRAPQRRPSGAALCPPLPHTVHTHSHMCPHVHLHVQTHTCVHCHMSALHGHTLTRTHTRACVCLLTLVCVLTCAPTATPMSMCPHSDTLSHVQACLLTLLCSHECPHILKHACAPLVHTHMCAGHLQVHTLTHTLLPCTHMCPQSHAAASRSGLQSLVLPRAFRDQQTQRPGPRSCPAAPGGCPLPAGSTHPRWPGLSHPLICSDPDNLRAGAAGGTPAAQGAPGRGPRRVPGRLTRCWGPDSPGVPQPGPPPGGCRRPPRVPGCPCHAARAHRR